MAVAKLRRAEIWNNIQAGSGVLLSNVSDITSATRHRNLDGSDVVTLTVPRTGTFWANVIERNVLRLVYTDNSVDEFRIVEPNDEESDEGEQTGTIVAESILMDLGRTMVQRAEIDNTVSLAYTLINLTPSQHITHVLGSAYAYFAAGTIDPTTPIDITYDFDSPLAALRKIAQAANAELQVVRNGGTNWQVNLLTQIGSSATVPQVRYRKNLDAMKRRVDAAELANRLYLRGGGDVTAYLTVANAKWRVNNIAGSVLSLDGGPILKDGSLVNLYIEKVGGGTSQITASSKSAQSVTVASATGVSVGDYIRFVINTSKKDLTYVEDSASVAIYGAVEGKQVENDLPMVDNLVPNPAFRDWSAGLPLSWSKISTPTVAQETSVVYTRSGGSSAHITASDGQGLICSAFSIAPTGDRKFFAGFVTLYLISGKVRFEFVHSNGLVYPDGQLAFTTKVNEFIQIKVENQEMPAGTVQLRVVSEGSSEWYLDEAQLTNSSGAQPFYAGRAANDLWTRGLNELAKRATPKVSYDIDIVDLYSIDQTLWPNESLTLGGSVFIRHEGLNITDTVRVIDMEQELLNGADVSVKLGSTVLTLEQRQLTTPKPQRPNPNDPNQTTPQLAALNLDMGSDFKVDLRIWAGSYCQSAKYSVSTSSAPTKASVIASGTSTNNVAGQIIADIQALAVGETAYVAVVAYRELSAAGQYGMYLTAAYTRLPDVSQGQNYLRNSSFEQLNVPNQGGFAPGWGTTIVEETHSVYKFSVITGDTNVKSGFRGVKTQSGVGLGGVMLSDKYRIGNVSALHWVGMWWRAYGYTSNDTMKIQVVLYDDSGSVLSTHDIATVVVSATSSTMAELFGSFTPSALNGSAKLFALQMVMDESHAVYYWDCFYLIESVGKPNWAASPFDAPTGDAGLQGLLMLNAAGYTTGKGIAQKEIRTGTYASRPAVSTDAPQVGDLFIATDKVNGGGGEKTIFRFKGTTDADWDPLIQSVAPVGTDKWAT